MCFNIDGLLRSNTTRLGRIRDQEEDKTTKVHRPPKTQVQIHDTKWMYLPYVVIYLLTTNDKQGEVFVDIYCVYYERKDFPRTSV